MFLLFPLRISLIVYFTVAEILFPPKKQKRRRQRQFVFHSDGKSDAEMAAELKQQFTPTKEWC